MLSPHKKPYILAFIATSLLFSQSSFAEKIYRWVDEEGKTHFTNDESLVPLKIEDTTVIKLKALPQPKEEKAALDGKSLWQSNCTECHVMSRQGSTSHRGIALLIESLKNPDATFEASLAVLQAAIDDNMDDATEIKLEPEEIQAIVKYIESQTPKDAPQKPETPQSKAK